MGGKLFLIPSPAASCHSALYTNVLPKDFETGALLLVKKMKTSVLEDRQGGSELGQ